jgi:hypothetical protein
MKSAIESMHPNETTINLHTKKEGRAWAAVMNAALLRLIEKNNGIYEVITHFPHKVYFDIDADTPIGLSSILMKIESFFPNAQMAISGSINPEKTSYHIILQNYIIRDETERQKTKVIVKQFHEDIKAFDWKVYTPNRNMKCINQSKPDGRIQEIIQDPDFRHHLITCFLPDSPMPFPDMPEELTTQVLIERSTSKFNLCSLPKMIIAIPQNFDLECATPLQILPLFPLNDTFAFDYVHRIVRYCFY